MEVGGGRAGAVVMGQAGKRYARSEGERHNATGGHSDGVQM